MVGTVGERVAAARRRAFVGRAAELAFVDAWLADAEPDVAVLAVHGPAGIGKSTLLRHLADRAVAAGVPALVVDGRDLPPLPDALTTALAPLHELPPGPALLLLDTLEAIPDADALLGDHVLPALPAEVRVVVAGQHPPATRWRTDPGWSEVLRVVRLDAFTAAECRDFLAARRLDPAAAPEVYAITHGHPLALALLAEVLRAGGSAAPGPSPDVVRDLLDRLLVAVPTPAHRAALEAAAQVRVLDEPLLGALVDAEDAADLFAWLRGLPFVEATRTGLTLHDLVRDAVAADLRWRDPARVRALRERARVALLARLDAGDGDPAQALLDLMALHDDLRQAMRLPGGEEPSTLTPLRDGDAEAVVAVVGRHEGDRSAEIARHLLADRPHAWVVVREAGERVAGFLCALRLPDQDPTAATPDDPAVVAAERGLAALPPLREGEHAVLFRFWMSAESYQSASPAQALLAAQLARTFLTAPGLAVSLLPCADPDEWADFLRYADHRRLPEAGFAVGERPYAVYAHDWRAVPPAAWLGALARRELGGPGPAAEPATSEAAVLGREDFAAAVKDGLRGLTRPARLATNPLLGSRVVAEASGPDAPRAERVAVLQRVLREAAATLRQSPADERLYRVLHRAYLAPAPTLERAAEALDLPSSTFRRYLAAAVARVVEALWERELRA